MSAVPSTTTGRRVLEMLQDRIDEGVYSPGRPLPSGRRLAEEFKADRATVMRALVSLRKQGVVRRISPRIHVVDQAATAASPSPRALANQTIAVVSIGSRYHPNHTQPGWVEYISLGALPAIESAGMHALSFHPAKLREQGIRHLVEAKPYGVVFTDLLTEPGEDEMLRQLADASVPFVVYGDGPSLASCDRVCSDHEQGAYDLTRELIRRGRRRILCFWVDRTDTPWLDARRRGHERAMAEAGLPVLPVAVHPEIRGVPHRAGFDASVRLTAGHLAEHLLGDEPADALMLTSDGDVPYAAAACRLLRKIPNQDVLLAGYDHYWADVPERQYEATPPVATIDKQNTRMGEDLVALLRQRVAGELPDAPQHRLVQPQLIVLDTALPVSGAAA